MSILLYCSINDVTEIASADGVFYRSDDIPPDLNGNVLERAAATINEYCLLRYSDATSPPRRG